MLVFQQFFFCLTCVFLWEFFQLLQLTLTGYELIWKNSGGWTNHEPLGLTSFGSPLVFSMGCLVAFIAIVTHGLPLILPEEKLIRDHSSEWSAIPTSLLKAPMHRNHRRWNLVVFLTAAFIFPGVLYFEDPESIYIHGLVSAMRVVYLPVSFAVLWRRFEADMPSVVAHHGILAFVVLATTIFSISMFYVGLPSFAGVAILTLVLPVAIIGGALVTSLFKHF